MHVPLLDLKAQYQAIEDEIDALLISLMALDIGPGDQVVTTAYSFFATAGAIARLGATPVFVDIDSVIYNIDSGKLAQVLALRRRQRDWRQSDGSLIVKRAGSMADTGCFSFFPSKNLGGLGDGGMVVTNAPKLYDKLKVLRVHGSQPKYYHKIIGGNFRLDAIQAAALLVKLAYLDGWTAGRQANGLPIWLARMRIFPRPIGPWRRPWPCRSIWSCPPRGWTMLPMP